MPDTNPTVEALLRSNRRWKIAAISSWALLAVVLAGGGLVAVQAWSIAEQARADERAAREAAQRALDEELKQTRANAERARDEVQQLIYARNIALAHQELERRAEKDGKK